MPLFYASNIPVILVAALVANLQAVCKKLIEGWLGRATFLGTFSNGVPVAGFAYWIGSTDLVTSRNYRKPADIAYFSGGNAPRVLHFAVYYVLGILG